MRFSRILSLVTLLLLAQSVFASSFRIDFSGTFSNECIDCWAYDTGDLRGTDFSGYVVFPDSGVPDPDAGIRDETLYYFDSNQAYFMLDAADDRFDYSDNMQMTAYVFDGDENFSRDRFSLFFYNDDYYFEMDLSQSTAQEPLDDEEMPTLAELQLLAASDAGSPFSVSNAFSIGNVPSFDGWIANYDDSDPYSYNPLVVSVSAIPLPPALALFPAALMVLVRYRRK